MNIEGIEEIAKQGLSNQGAYLKQFNSIRHDMTEMQLDSTAKMMNDTWGFTFQSLEHSLETRLSKEMAERSLSKLFDQFSTIKKLMDNMG